MKKNTVYTLLIILFAASVSFVLYKYYSDKNKSETTDYTLLNRTGVAAQLPDWQSTQTNAGNFIRLIHANPDDAKSRIGLATLFIKEARITGNYTYYDMAALKYVNDRCSSTVA